MAKVSFVANGKKVSFTTGKRSGKSPRKLNPFAKLVKKVSKETGLSGPELMYEASAQYHGKKSSKKVSSRKSSSKRSNKSRAKCSSRGKSVWRKGHSRAGSHVKGKCVKKSH